MVTKQFLSIGFSLALLSLSQLNSACWAVEAQQFSQEAYLEHKSFNAAVEAASSGNKAKLLKIYDYDVLYELSDAAHVSNSINQLLKNVHHEAKKIYRAGNPKEAADRLELAFDFSTYVASKFDDETSPPDRPPEYWLHGWKLKTLQISPLIYIPAVNDYGFFLQKAGQNAEAVRILQAVISEDPQREVAYLNLADSLWRLGRESEAKPYFEKYKELMALEKKEGLVPEHVNAILHLSGSIRPHPKDESSGAGQLDFSPWMSEAQKMIKQNWSPPKGDVSQLTVVQFDIDKSGQLSNISTTKSSNEKYTETAIAAVHAAHLPPLPVNAPNKLSLAFTFAYNVIHKVDKMDDELNLWRRRVEKSASAENYAGLGLALEAAGDFNEAEIQFKTATKLSPQNQHYQTMLSDCQNQVNELRKQIADFGKTPGPAPRLVVAQASLNNEGVKALNAGDFKGAIEKLRRALAIEPGYKLARNNLAIVFNNKGIAEKEKHSLALADFHLSLLLKPGDRATEKNVETLLQKSGKLRDSYAMRRDLADTLASKEDYAGAIAEYRRALKIKDDPKIEEKLSAIITRIMSPSFVEKNMAVGK